MLLDLIALDHSSKVWIYQAKNFISEEIIDDVRSDIHDFLEQWASHNNRLYTYGNVFHYRFIVLFVDERYAGASGCSIDSSVRFIKTLEEKYDMQLFDRMDVCYMEKLKDEEGEDISKIHTVHLHELKLAYAENTINDQTFVFNNLVKTKGEFLSQWVTPFSESWHKKFVV